MGALRHRWRGLSSLLTLLFVTGAPATDMDLDGGFDGMGDEEDMPYDDDDSMMGGEGGGGEELDSALGAVKLDNYTFDKVIGLPGQTVFVKFDEVMPAGDKEDEYKELCKLAYTAPNFFVGEVQVPDGEEPENDDLRQRFKLARDEFPVFLLFRGPEDMVRYEGQVTAADMSVWLRKHGVKISSSGTIAELDDVVQKFLAEGLADSHIAEAKSLAEGTYKSDPKAPIYVRTMTKMKERGIGYAKAEVSRVEKVMKGRLTPEKLKELNEKLRVLSVFQREETKDEL